MLNFFNIKKIIKIIVIALILITILSFVINLFDGGDVSVPAPPEIKNISLSDNEIIF